HRRYLWRLPTDLWRRAQLVSERLDSVRAAIPVQYDRQAEFRGDNASRSEIRDPCRPLPGRLLTRGPRGCGPLAVGTPTTTKLPRSPGSTADAAIVRGLFCQTPTGSGVKFYGFGAEPAEEARCNSG